jgi:hypothetical protein
MVRLTTSAPPARDERVWTLPELVWRLRSLGEVRPVGQICSSRRVQSDGSALGLAASSEVGSMQCVESQYSSQSNESSSSLMRTVTVSPGHWSASLSNNGNVSCGCGDG